MCPSLPGSRCGEPTVRAAAEAETASACYSAESCPCRSVMLGRTRGACGSVCRASRPLCHSSRSWHRGHGFFTGDHTHAESPALTAGHHHAPYAELCMVCSATYSACHLEHGLPGLLRPNPCRAPAHSGPGTRTPPPAAQPHCGVRPLGWLWARSSSSEEQGWRGRKEQCRKRGAVRRDERVLLLRLTGQEGCRRDGIAEGVIN